MEKIKYNDLILLKIKDKLDKGKKQYGGHLNPHDGRNWHKEALDEILDGMAYIAAKLIELEERK